MVRVSSLKLCSPQCRGRRNQWRKKPVITLDITYSNPDSSPEPESLRAVVKKLCSKMLSALDKYFNVDYRVSLVFGTAKSEYTGLAPNIREALIKIF